MNHKKPTIIDHGLVIEHDMPCAVCCNASAVYHMQEGIFKPCWKCQQEGWSTSKGLWATLMKNKVSMSSALMVDLRDNFALAALRELIAADLPFLPKGEQSYCEARAELAYIYADAMLKARVQT